MTHICVGKLTIIGSDNGLSPQRRRAIIWTNAGILLIGPLGTNFSEILIEIQTCSFKKMHLKMSSAKWRLSGLGFNVLRSQITMSITRESHWSSHITTERFNVNLRISLCMHISSGLKDIMDTGCWSNFNFGLVHYNTAYMTYIHVHTPSFLISSSLFRNARLCM